MSEPLLQLRGVSKTFVIAGVLWQPRRIQALYRVDLGIQPGETFGVVGESGSGKSTLCRIVLGVIRPTAGRVLFDGRDIGTLSRREMRRVRRQMQAVFQDPTSSLNPRQSVRSALLAPLEVHNLGTKRGRLDLVAETLNRVGLDPTFLDRRPHQLSGGECQRVAIARAIILHPSLVVADEPTSALDVSVQAQILNLFKETQRELGLTYLFVSHNLAVIRYVSHRVGVMYLGQVVEVGPIEQVFTSPQHPYARALLEAVPRADPTKRHRDLAVLDELPDAYQVPPGCRFHSRCPVAMDVCSQEEPPLYLVGESHHAACLWHDERFTAAAPPWISSNRPAVDPFAEGSEPAG